MINFRFFIFLMQLIIYSKTEDLNIKLLGVVFRHGDRAPDPGRESYPNDPHKNHNFSALVPGELNNNGKSRELELGKRLREQYDKFLGEIYYPKNVVARATDYRRTRASLQLVLAGLYPPKNSQIWNPNLNWQPFSTQYIPGDYDNLLIPEECPQFLEELARVRELDEIKEQLVPFFPLLRNLTEWTGKTINSSIDMYDLFNSLSAEASMGLKLPDWAENLIPHGRLFDGIILEYKTVHFNEKLRRLNGGAMIKYLVDRINQIKKGLKLPEIHLFSGHETNIAALLNTLQVFKPHVPHYSSAIIIELLQNDTNYFVKMRYYKGIPQIFEDITIPGCNVTCPLENFIQLMKNSIPADSEMVCKKTGSLYRTKKPDY